jgi:hypothetical protein
MESLAFVEHATMTVTRQVEAHDMQKTLTWEKTA